MEVELSATTCLRFGRRDSKHKKTLKRRQEPTHLWATNKEKGSVYRWQVVCHMLWLKNHTCLQGLRPCKRSLVPENLPLKTSLLKTFGACLRLGRGELSWDILSGVTSGDLQFLNLLPRRWHLFGVRSNHCGGYWKIWSRLLGRWIRQGGGCIFAFEPWLSLGFWVP